MWLGCCGTACLQAGAGAAGGRPGRAEVGPRRLRGRRAGIGRRGAGPGRVPASVRRAAPRRSIGRPVTLFGQRLVRGDLSGLGPERSRDAGGLSSM